MIKIVKFQVFKLFVNLEIIMKNFKYGKAFISKMISPLNYIKRNRDSWLFRQAEKRPILFFILALIYYLIILAIIIAFFYCIYAVLK